MKQRTRPMFNGDDFTYNMAKKDAAETHEIQLHRVKPQEHFIEAQVQDGDTLQAIALRFYCSIAELKRINHIHKDNEIFARRTIKVPVTPYSVLTELIPTQTPEPVPSTSNQTAGTTLDNLLHSHTYNGLAQQNNVSSDFMLPKEDGDCSIDCNTVVMNSTLAPSVVPYTDVEPNEHATEDTQLLPNKEKIPVETVVVKELTSQGADLGLKWFHLVCFLIILGVIAPIVYVMFYLKVEHPDIHTTEHPAIKMTEHLDLPPLRSY